MDIWDQMEIDLLRDGTVIGPVTPEMVKRCKAHYSDPKEARMWWPDMLSIVRQEIKEEQDR